MKHSLSLLIIPSLILSCSMMSSPVAKARGTIVVAVIDTGISSDLTSAKFLCKFGHKDFTGTSLHDHEGHGTHVSGLIDQYVKDLVFDTKLMPIKKIQETPAKYCQVILKWYDSKQIPSNVAQQGEDAFQRAIDLKVDIINFSGGGSGYSYRESRLIKKALDMGIVVVVAAGNENSDIDKVAYYPAVLDKRIIVVGNLSWDSTRSPTSNYGSKVDVWEFGSRRTSYGLDGKVAIMTGTSQATAVKTGKLIRQMLNSR